MNLRRADPFPENTVSGNPEERYEVEETQKETELLCGIAENRKCITKGGELDYSKAAALLIDEFRSGKL